MPYDELEMKSNGWTKWIQPIRKKYKIQCCDCGLVHTVDFRVRKRHVQFRVFRNNRSTGQIRRYMEEKS